MRLILASASPRRAQLLAAAQIPFEVRPADIDEAPFQDEEPSDYVQRVAIDKARAAIQPVADEVLLAADTTVVVDGEILGKPSDEADAARMLRLLSGRVHEVLSGIAVVRPGSQTVTFESSLVRLLPLTDAQIGWYVGTGEPFGKAGAYAVQGLASRFVDRIEGSYSNVVGLPVSRVYQILEELGFFEAARR